MEYKKLKDLCYIDKGKTPISKAKDGEYPLIATAEEFKSSDSYDFDCKAVCIPLVSSTGHGHASLKRLHYYDGKFALGTILARLTSKDEKILLSNYLYIYLLFFKDELLVSMMKGSANVSLTVTAIKNLEIPVPEIEKQKKVVDLYNELVPLLDELKNEILQEEEMNALFKDKILDLAVRGELVEQDKNDEPASVLIEKIKAEKEKLIKEGKIKKNKNESFIYRKDGSFYEKIGKEEKCIDDEIPFEIPETWEWCRLGEIFMQNTGKALNSKNNSGELLEYITTSNLYWNMFDLSRLKQMYFNENEIEKYTVKKGDLLVCEGGDIGRAAVWNYNFDICIQNHVHKLRPYLYMDMEFFVYVFYICKVKNILGGKGIGIKGLSSKTIRQIIIPLPPLAEQKRIVEKIELLNKYLDESLEEINNSKSQIESIMKCLLNDILEK